MFLGADLSPEREKLVKAMQVVNEKYVELEEDVSSVLFIVYQQSP
jgi:hypothetical protein